MNRAGKGGYTVQRVGEKQDWHGDEEHSTRSSLVENAIDVRLIVAANLPLHAFARASVFAGPGRGK